MNDQIYGNGREMNAVLAAQATTLLVPKLRGHSKIGMARMVWHAAIVTLRYSTATAVSAIIVVRHTLDGNVGGATSRGLLPQKISGAAKRPRGGSFTLLPAPFSLLAASHQQGRSQHTNLMCCVLCHCQAFSCFYLRHGSTAWIVCGVLVGASLAYLGYKKGCCNCKCCSKDDQSQIPAAADAPEVAVAVPVGTLTPLEISAVPFVESTIIVASE